MGTLFGTSISTLQAAVPAVLALLSGVISFFRFSGRGGRMRAQIKETLELAKLAEDSKASTAKEKLDKLLVEQVARLQAFELKVASRTYDKRSLATALILLALGSAAAWGLFSIDFVVTTVLAWIVIAFLAIFVPTGVVMFFTNDRSDSAST